MPRRCGSADARPSPRSGRKVPASLSPPKNVRRSSRFADSSVKTVKTATSAPSRRSLRSNQADNHPAQCQHQHYQWQLQARHRHRKREDRSSPNRTRPHLRRERKPRNPRSSACPICFAPPTSSNSPTRPYETATKSVERWRSPSRAANRTTTTIQQH